MLDASQNIFLIVVWVALSMVCLVLLNRVWAPARRRVHNDVIGWQISVLGTVYAVMIGFMLYAVWANFQTAEANANNEANALVNLYRTANGLSPDRRDALEIAAANYANVVINNEWPTMGRGEVPRAGHPFIAQMWAITTQASMENSQQASLRQAMQELSNLTQHRRIRILESQTKMPTILWTVLVVGGVITIASCCLIGSENAVLHFCLIFALSLLISLSLIAIADIDGTFQGSVHITPHAFVRAQETMTNPGAP